MAIFIGCLRFRDLRLALKTWDFTFNRKNTSAAYLLWFVKRRGKFRNCANVGNLSLLGKLVVTFSWIAAVLSLSPIYPSTLGHWCYRRIPGEAHYYAKESPHVSEAEIRLTSVWSSLGDITHLEWREIELILFFEQQV